MKLLHDPWVDVALNTLSLAVATVPESLPIVLTFALSLGARQMARRKAVVRQLSVVESLGSVDIICTDKTGTLTMNQMSLQRFWAGNRAWEPGKDTLSNVARQALVAGILCNEAVLPANGSTPIGDPVDSAFMEAAHRFGLEAKVERSIAPVVRILPFSAERKRMTTLHQTGAGVVAFMKGAPGVVLERCSAIAQEEGTLPLDPPRFAILRELADSWQADGYYLLAVARKDNVDPKNPVEGEEGMTFLGLVGMIDPPRPEAAMAISRAREAGIRVVMITGDNLRTAQAIVRQLGIGEEGLQAGELEGASLMQIGERLQGVDIVARATPKTKQQVLEALQAKGHFVAMTGDGVNDATALKQSDVGIAMGMRGTDIAKESADMVLLDDRFDTIVAAVEEGRRIFDNIRKFTNYLLSTSLGAVLMVLLLSVAGYFPLSAQMLLWVNVITDLIPASALAADPVVPQIMKRRPRHRSEPILNRAIYATIAGSIFRTLIAYSLIFWLGLLWGGIAYARTMLFTSIVLHAFTRVMVVRQLDSLTLWSNRALLWSYAVAVGLQLLALYTPLRVLFGAVALDWRAWALMIPVTAGSSLAGIAMTRWILRKIPLWEQEKPAPRLSG